MEKQTAKKGNLAITLSTYLYILFDRGIPIQNTHYRGLCEDLKNCLDQPTVAEVVSNILDNVGSDVKFNEDDLIEFVKTSGQPTDSWQDRDPFEIGKELVTQIENTLDNYYRDSGTSTGKLSAEGVLTMLQGFVPDICNGWSESENQTILQSIRKYEFSRGLPWISQIAERTENGIEELWVLVEKVTDSVLCMDPYPWDDVDEEFEMDLNEFLIRWELCGSVAIHLQ